MKAPKTKEAFGKWVEEVWRYREEHVYPRVFTTMRDGIVTLDQSPAPQQLLGSQYAKAKALDVVWNFKGVMVSPPHAGRDSWIYVTSGLSAPDDLAPGDEIADDALSGWGFELAIQSRVEAKWPIARLLELMAYVLVCQKPFGVGHRFPFVNGVTDEGPRLDHVLFVEAPEYPPAFHLHSGHVSILTAVGVTRREVEFARQNSSAGLWALLATSTGALTDESRNEVALPP